jgi:hypothetical protein
MNGATAMVASPTKSGGETGMGRMGGWEEGSGELLFSSFYFLFGRAWGKWWVLWDSGRKDPHQKALKDVKRTCVGGRWRRGKPANNAAFDLPQGRDSLQ